MEKGSKNWTKWLFWFSLAFAIIMVYKTLDSFNAILGWFGNLFHIIAPFLIGILISYIFYIPCKNIEKLYSKFKIKWVKRKSRALSVITVYLITFVFVGICIRFIVPTISKSVIEIANNIPNYYNLAIEKLDSIPENSFIKTEDINQFVDNVENIDFKSMLNISNITQYIKNVVGFARGIFDIFVTLIVSIYILLDRKAIIKFLNKLTKAIFDNDKYISIKKYFKKSNEVFFKFLYSQILDGIVVGILTSIIMLILKVKYAILLGFMIGLFNLIPFFGAIFAVGIAILITVFTGGISKAIWVAICVICMQQIDANIINPKIIGNSLEISSLLVIFSITVFGAYFGVVGMFLAVPIMVVLKIILENYIDNRLNMKKNMLENKREYTPIEFDEEFKEKE